MTELTDDAVGKTVVGANGKELGVVASVENETAHVDPNPSLAEQVMSTIGWEDADEEDYRVTEDMVDHVDEEVVLQGDL
ncbi:MAG TPA: PRC-barrel domain containing protein [Natronoarchaeum rubrum]|nr:PRC-barrel domain containing protein [Natronoarchaeum rubrum]